MKKLIVTIVAAITVLFSANAQSVHSAHSQEMAQSTTTKADKHAMLKVQGKCDMCKTRIKKAALSVAGVSSAVWDVKDKMLHLNFDAAKTNLNAISKAIAKVGHDTEKEKADQKVYDTLPGCCKYRK